MEKQTITIYDVAREAGVSMATVSRVVNGNPNVKPSTRDKVSEVINRLNYRPNAVARGLASKKTTTVGVIIPSIMNQFFASLASGIDDIAAMYKYNIILANSDENSDKEIKVFNTLLAKQVDGMIVMGYDISSDLLREVDRVATPVVFAGTVIEDEDHYVVNIDDRSAIYDATMTLLSQSQSVAMVMQSKHTHKNAYRVEGFKQALEEHNVPFNEDLIISTDFDYRHADRIVDEIIDLNVGGILVLDDEIGVGILNDLIKRGYKIPEDFQMISGHNTLLTELSRPMLSSIELPLYDIGAVAMRLLTKIMNNEDDINSKQIVLPHKIKLRDSTK